MLDLLANRCLASRTNAWTAVDHTCYTVYTAGTSGFLQILPIYLDHILFPTLRKEDFATEVHHISGRGRYMVLRVIREPVKYFFAFVFFCQNASLGNTNALCKSSMRMTLEKFHLKGTKLCFCEEWFLHQKKRYIFIPNFCKEEVAAF